MKEFYLKNETYQIIGICMEVHNNLGMGFSEIVYKDALELEFKAVRRMGSSVVKFKSQILNHKFYADFFVFDEVILEIKGVSSISQ